MRSWNRRIPSAIAHVQGAATRALLYTYVRYDTCKIESPVQRQTYHFATFGRRIRKNNSCTDTRQMLVLKTVTTSPFRQRSALH